MSEGNAMLFLIPPRKLRFDPTEAGNLVVRIEHTDTGTHMWTTIGTEDEIALLRFLESRREERRATIPTAPSEPGAGKAERDA